MYPPQNGQYWHAFPIFYQYLPQIWQTTVAKQCMPMSSRLQGRYVRECRVRTKGMELLTRTVLYLQGSDAGQKYFKI